MSFKLLNMYAKYETLDDQELQSLLAKGNRQKVMEINFPGLVPLVTVLYNDVP